VPEMQWLSGTGSGVWSERFPRQSELDVSRAIALPDHLWTISNDHRRDLPNLETYVGQAAVPYHPLLCIMPRCMSSHLKCKQAAVIVNIGVFG
jgi:hypothetical protein